MVLEVQLDMQEFIEWNGTTWNQLGSDIDGEAAGDQSGWSVGMSGNGNRVIEGARFNDGNNSNSSRRMYQWTGSAWVQMGADMVNLHWINLDMQYP